MRTLLGSNEQTPLAAQAGAQHHTLNNAQLVAFLFAGDAIFTLLSQTGQRYTYRVEKREFIRKGATETETCYWVCLLTGPHNLVDYTYLGTLKTAQERTFRLSPKSRVKQVDLPSVAAVSWLLSRIQAWEQGDQVKNLLPPGMSFYHAGLCGRCKAVLTDPTSIEQGFGPDCVKLVAREAPRRRKVHAI